MSNFSPNIISAFDQFLIYLRIHKGKSPKTLEQYAFHIWRFIRWLNPDAAKKLPKKYNHFIFLLQQNNQPSNIRREKIQKIQQTFSITIDQIKKEDIDTWRLDLADAGLSIKTVNAHIITLRSWFKYLKKEGIACIDPTSLDLMSVPDREVTFLTADEIERFFASIACTDIQGIRNFAICECIYSTGLRISELTNLNKNDVNLETMEFAVRGKGNKIRTVYLTESAKNAIGTYLDTRDDHFSPLFIRHNFSKETLVQDDTNVRLSRFFITNMIKDYGVKAGILKNIHAHTLRHSFATTLLGNGADIRIIQELLGHASITTTQVYTHVTNPKLKEAHKKFHTHKK